MRTFIIISFTFSLFALAPSALAQTGGTVRTDGTTGNTRNGTVQNDGQTSNTTNTRLINPLNSGECAPNENCLLNFLERILEFVIRIGTVVIILMIVYVGFLFVVARGEPGKLTTARQALLWTVIGGLILLGSKVIAEGIKATVQALSG